MICGVCGQRSADAAKYCGGCGRALPTAPPGASEEPESGPVSLARPSVITVLAILNFVAGVVLLGSAAVAAAALRGTPDLPPAAAIVAFGVLLPLAALKLACGAGLWWLKAWGRWLQIGLSCLGLLIIPFGTVLSALILYFVFKPGIRVLFSGKSAADLTSAEVQAVRKLGSANAAVVIVVVVGLLFAMVPVTGIIAAIAIPNLLNAVQRGKQLRTMADLRSLGTAVESYQVGYGFIPNVPSSPDAAAALAPSLEPTFLRSVPRLDGWQHPFVWESQRMVEDGVPESRDYSIISFGKDGQADPTVPMAATTSFHADIYFSNGQFIQYPEGTQN